MRVINGYGYIDIDEIIDKVSHLKREDIRNINIPNSTLYGYKRDPNKLFNAKFNHIIAIAQYIQQNTIYIGMDIGGKNYIATSTIDRSKTYIDKSKEIEHILKKYDNRINHKKYDDIVAYSKLKTSLTNHISKNIKDIVKRNQTKTVYVLGEVPNYRNSIISLIFDLTYNVLQRKIKQEDEIILINERHTSILCPECGYKDKKNRTKSNGFQCKNCEFQHDNNDIVAASNIANRAYKKGYFKYGEI
ncbi:zinc ribbon domain-containing protein [Mammaliicoccus sciuri]|uniref:zinc ribbon domain-containing protein n=1 Tax=Mammaliicoccus sciuri TaxID=1296 RepID=UPI000CD1E718|nr:zinc ribbon domain-containing protein [Mammaliicoccus sciuri]MDT0696755.1 zinc ribbon domain-containing protein [Mammaliicoccus sciuri]PNZ29423.1 transposase [Mammaliicoccus sciuri]